ncbi:hypothetical protein K8R62_03710 [bacterium]|nr:hypothetical protein [bacterium]
MYSLNFGIFTKEKEQKIINYQGNFKEVDDNDASFNNSITSGIVVNIEKDFLYVAPFPDSSEKRRILLDKKTKYIKLRVDSNYGVIDEKNIGISDVKLKDSVVVVPRYSDKEGALDFSIAEEVRIILVNDTQ